MQRYKCPHEVIQAYCITYFTPNRAQIILEKLEQHLKQNTQPASHMVHAPRKTIWEEQRELANIRFGDWVEVLYEYMPGTCSDGGVGIITRLQSTGEENSVDVLFASVKFVLDNRVEYSINFDRLTIIPMPYKSSER
jgi:hypothetical protein